MGLGPVNLITLAEAREKARNARTALLDGDDPSSSSARDRARQRLEAAKGMTFKGCAERMMASHEAAWKNPKHRQQWRNTLATYAYPIFGDAAGCRGRHRARAQGARADLDDEARDGGPGARPDRGGARLGEGARLPRRREPGALARPSRQAAAEPRARCAAVQQPSRPCPTPNCPAFMAELREQPERDRAGRLSSRS